MTPIEKRKELLAAHVIKNLNRRNMDAWYYPTAKEAVEKVVSMIPLKGVVSWGGSMTIRNMGLIEALYAEDAFVLLDRDRVKSGEEAAEIYLKAFRSDVYITGANAISQDGVIVNIDGNGNRVAAITFGPKRVIFIIGLNKVAYDVNSALARARNTAAPINTARFDINTPCKKDGVCHNCNSLESICNYVHLLRNSPKRKHSVILIGEDFGY